MSKLASPGMSSVFVIAEAGMNHDGSLGNAIRMAEVAAECGADAVKFQLHDAAAESTRDAPSPPYFSGESRWDYFRRTAFTDEQWATLKEACDRVQIEFVCSAFSVEAVERLEQLAVRRYKIGSGEVTNLELVRRVAATGKPVLLTSGMSSWQELDTAVEAAGNDVIVLQCTSSYPTPPERVGLNVLEELRERYGKPVGLSDHTIGNYAAFAAVTLGAVVVEKHFTLSKFMYGPDAAFAMEPDELEDLVEGIRDIETMLANPVDKDDLEPVAEMKLVFEKSVVTVAEIPAGAVIAREMVAAKKPGTGIPAARLDEVVGRTARVDLPADTVLTEDALA
jgi:sialic acid synthase SpsE